MRWMIATLVLMGCGGMRSVPVEALAEVPTGAVATLSDLQAEIDESAHAIEDTQARHAEIERNLDDAERALESAQVDLEQTQESRARAVAQGDFETAEDLDDDLTSAQETVNRRKARYDEQVALLDLTDQAIRLREARLEARRAGLETARAQAAAEGGADVKVERFEKQQAKYEQRVQEEADELAQLENAYELEL